MNWLGEPSATRVLTANQDKIYWSGLSNNPSAIELLTANQDKINWSVLSKNPSDGAIALLKMNQDSISDAGTTGAKIDWETLSGNPSAIELMKINPDKSFDISNLSDKINRWSLASNSIVFQINKTKHQQDIKQLTYVLNRLYT